MSTSLSIRPTVLGRIVSAIVVLFGVALLAGGLRLASVGGSYYYAIIGLIWTSSGIFVWRGRPSGTWLYVGGLAITAAWSIAEVGLDGWALGPRMVFPLLLGIALLAAAGPRFSTSQFSPRHIVTRTAAVLLALVVGIVVLTANNWHARAPVAPSPVAANGDGDWPGYGNDSLGSHFSPLSQINANNISKLQVAWIYRSKDFGIFSEATPIKVGDRLFTCTPHHSVIALDPETGKELWRFESGEKEIVGLGVCRGVAYYQIPGTTTGPCVERILTITGRGSLVALDATTGLPCAGFGENGRVSLLKNLGHSSDPYFPSGSPPMVVHGRVILGSTSKSDTPSGVIRAYDAVNGNLMWAWDAGRADDPVDASRDAAPYSANSVNAWGVFSGDEELGLVYVPTGNSRPAYIGINRSASNDHYGSSILAIDVDTGHLRWSFQTTHHDIWDYDVPAQPILVDLPSGHSDHVPALMQVTKRGEFFLLDRRTGLPLANVEERPAHSGGPPGERLSATQPFSAGMPSLDPAPLKESDMWGLTPLDQMMCRIEFRRLTYQGIFTPLASKPSLVYPGVIGGVDWGGASIDSDRRIALVNSNNLAFWAQLTRHGTYGLSLYSYPQVGTEYDATMMPFLGIFGVPCQRPPWGQLTAVSLDSRKILWSRPIGTSRDTGPFGWHAGLPLLVGTISMGGTLTTRGGLTFFGGTMDRFLRAYDAQSGTELWRARLPAGGQASPMSYISRESGRQFIVITAGGHALLQSKSGDYTIAYALPREAASH